MSADFVVTPICRLCSRIREAGRTVEQLFREEGWNNAQGFAQDIICALAEAVIDRVERISDCDHFRVNAAGKDDNGPWERGRGSGANCQRTMRWIESGKCLPVVCTRVWRRRRETGGRRGLADGPVDGTVGMIGAVEEGMGINGGQWGKWNTSIGRELECKRWGTSGPLRFIKTVRSGHMWSRLDHSPMWRAKLAGGKARHDCLDWPNEISESLIFEMGRLTWLLDVEDA